MSSGNITERTVSCPACKGQSVYSARNPFRPFCSERCKHLDFSMWATEGYRVEATPELPDDIGVDGDLRSSS